MSKHDSLPPELAEIESQLRGLPLPPASLDRDATLYRAGWAAAEAQFHSGASRHGWFWPATSAVLAASVLVLSLFLIDGNHSTVVAHEKPLPSGEGLIESESVDVDSAPAESLLPPACVRRFSPDDQSLLAVRERALRGVFAAPARPTTQESFTVREPKTNRELLNEMLKGSTNS